MVNGRPGDQRGFLHKKILRGIATVAGVLPIPGAGVISTVARTLAGGSTSRARRSIVAPRTPITGTMVLPTRFGGPGPCPPPLIRSRAGLCVFAGSPLGQDPDLGVTGEAVNGRFGAAIVPSSIARETRECPAGMALGKDALCYDHLPNRDRLYPRGRRPLLTGGEMRCITRAAGAARKIKRTEKNLRKLGMLRSPTRRACK